MLKNKNIICISSIDWDFVWQGHQEIMNTFVKEGNRVLFIENTGIRMPNISDIPRIKKRLTSWFKSLKGIRKEKEGLFIYSPVILPFPYSGLAAFFNRFIMLSILKKWMKVVDFANPIIWTFLPTRTAIDLIRNIDHEISIYYCIADFTELVSDKKKLQKSERRLLKTVDIVFAQGIILRDACLKYNKNVSVFPFGVRGGLFNRENRAPESSCPEDIKKIKDHRIGYVGGLHKHIDYELLEYMANKKPEWSIILIGPDQVNYLNSIKPKNIIMVGMKKYEELPDYISSMNVCLIPYKISEYTNTVYPTKLNEYLLMGKPVVSTALPEIREFNRFNEKVVRIAESKEEFLKVVEDALTDNSPAEIAKRKKAAMANTWEERVKEMSEIIEEKIAEKESLSAGAWRESLLSVYRRSKIKVIKTAFLVMGLYLFIFYSPAVWFIAEPLKISEMPERSDAIVVFGGGVGETGSPGKSTIERARYSVDLYKRGFSKYIVYSSGYTYKYNDAENMKLFAISMGVPKDNVILEQKANSTYENVKYAIDILRKKNFGKVMIVSSPYNMKRASLVFNHMAKDLKVIYVPVPDPEFYRKIKPIELTQIVAIMHEYMGIAYYYLKGYI